jgi:galactose mutarotase-like enzyme
VDFPDCEHFLLWHKYAAPFICLEPWNGISDTVGTSYDITEKEGISTLDAGESYLNTHKITFM